MDWAPVLQTPMRRVDNPAGSPKVYHLKGWRAMTNPERVALIARVSEQAGMDPRLATLAVEIFRANGVEPRDYRGQAAALLAWVQQNIYYVNEPDERLQDPEYTLRVRYGDCDDMAILLAALAHSVRLPVRPVISGRDARGKLHRYHHGDKTITKGVGWAHIYLQICLDPYGNGPWTYAEPTLQVPLGWDVVGANGRLPELGDGAADASSGPSTETVAKPHRFWHPSAPLNLNWWELGFTIALGVATATVTQTIMYQWQQRLKSEREKQPNLLAWGR